MCRFSLFITNMAYFSMPNSIPISWLYILTDCIKIFIFFFFVSGEEFHVVQVRKVVDLFLRYTEFVSGYSLSDSMSPHVSRTLLSILADFNDAVVWIFSTRPFNSKSSSLCNNPLVTLSRVTITISITITFMFYNFFQFSSKVHVVIFVFEFFQF